MTYRRKAELEEDRDWRTETQRKEMSRNKGVGVWGSWRAKQLGGEPGQGVCPRCAPTTQRGNVLSGQKHPPPSRAPPAPT